MSRKLAREYTYKLIFEFLFNLSPNNRTYGVFSHSDLEETDVLYMEKVYYGVVSHYEELKEIIAEYSQGFAFDRIYRTDLSAMLISIYEMKYLTDVPPSVSISEAILLVKKYSTEKSNSFVNGILSSVYKNLYGGKDDNN